MKSIKSFLFIILFFTLCFVVFFKALRNDSTYIPEVSTNKSLVNVEFRDFNTNEITKLNKILNNEKFYLINIWSSWCIPCVEENSKLLELSKLQSLKLVGLNYKDKKKNAEYFLREFGNPYDKLYVDLDGTTSIELGAYGVPETFLVNSENFIVSKYIGPLNKKNVLEIKKKINENN